MAGPRNRRKDVARPPIVPPQLRPLIFPSVCPQLSSAVTLVTRCAWARVTLRYNKAEIADARFGSNSLATVAECEHKWHQWHQSSFTMSIFTAGLATPRRRQRGAWNTLGYLSQFLVPAVFAVFITGGTAGARDKSSWRGDVIAEPRERSWTGLQHGGCSSNRCVLYIKCRVHIQVLSVNSFSHVSLRSKQSPPARSVYVSLVQIRHRPTSYRQKPTWLLRRESG